MARVIAVFQNKKTKNKWYKAFKSPTTAKNAIAAIQKKTKNVLVKKTKQKGNTAAIARSIRPRKLPF